MAMFDFITNTLQRILPVREVEVPTLGENLDLAVAGALRDLNAMTILLERMSEGSGQLNCVYSLLSRQIAIVSDSLECEWRDERKHCGLDTDPADLSWVHGF